MYDPAAPVLKTLTRDRESQRVREIQPGEKIDSIYDDIHHEGSRFIYHDTSKKEHSEPPAHLFYNQADVLQDQILFPDEYVEDSSKASVGEPANSLVRLENGPVIERFIYDLDTDDEDFDKPCDHSEGDEEYDEEEDEEDEIEDDYSIDAEGQPSQELTDQTGEGKDKPDLSHLFETEELRQTFEIFKNWHLTTSDKAPAMKEQWDEWMDRERSKGMNLITEELLGADWVLVFKEVWHKADMEPGAQDKYIKMADMVKKVISYDFSVPMRKLYPLQLLVWMKVHPQDHRYVVKDMEKAAAMMGLFFPSGFCESEAGLEFKDSPLINQEKRTTMFPDRRRHDSNRCMPNEHWKEWDAIHVKGHVSDSIPMEWDIAIRPVVARREFFSCAQQQFYPANIRHYCSIQRGYHLQLLFEKCSRSGGCCY